MKEKLKELAVKRLLALTQKGLDKSVLNDFKKDGTIYYSERMPLGNAVCGILYYLNDLGGAPKEWQEKVMELEKSGRTLVYHATHEYTEFGELLDLWIVTEDDVLDEEQWAEEDFKNGYQFCYVMNINEPLFSEYGDIGYKISGGGCVRV